jgi:hypothetical protein
MLTSRRICIALCVASLASVVLVSVADAGEPADVTVRVEGLSETKLPPTSVTTSTASVVKDGEAAHSCAGTSAAGALEVATAGAWSGKWYSGLGYSVESIKGENFPFTGINYWSFWLDNKPATTGICEAELHSGDSILFFPGCYSETAGECPPAPNPLGIEAATVAQVGVPVSVTVTSYANETGTPSPAKEATITYAGSTTKTDSSGHATLTFSHAEQANAPNVTVTAPESVRTETTICVHNGNDGNCGTQAPGGAVTSNTTGTVTQSPYKGAFAVVPNVSGLQEGHHYAAGKAPRVLAGTISTHSAVTAVSLKLRREYRARCYAYDGTRDRFVKARCGQATPFKVSSDGTFSYLLPSALAPGRYVLDVLASDAAGNTTALARGTSRIVFYVK